MDNSSHVCITILGFGKTGKSIHTYPKSRNVAHNILLSTKQTINDSYIIRTYDKGHIHERQISKAELRKLIASQKQAYISPGIQNQPTDCQRYQSIWHCMQYRYRSMYADFEGTFNRCDGNFW